MPATLMWLIVFAIIGASIASVGGVLGWWRWRALSRGQQLVAVFLSVSGALGFAQLALRNMKVHNHWVGNLWALCFPLILMPALMTSIRRHERRICSLVRWFMLIVWFWHFVLRWNINEFALWYQLVQYIILIGLGFGMVVSLAFVRREAHKLPAFWISIVFCGAGFFDAPIHMVYASWVVNGGESVLFLWAARNAAWILAYAALAYTLTLHDYVPQGRRMDA